MTCQDNERLLNNVLIQLARSFLQYVAEASPWVSRDASSLEAQVLVLAARQRQDVAAIAALLNQREHAIDFGSFPTEYTDQQFLALDSLIDGIIISHQLVGRQIAAAQESLRAAGDTEAAELLRVTSSHEQDIAAALQEIAAKLKHSAAATT
jgi:hypothetical protein